MKTIKEVKIYICPETGKKCRSRTEAERSAATAIKAKEEAAIAAEQKRLADQSNLEKKDWLRLNLTNIADIPKLVKEKAKEFWNLDCEIELNVSFGQVSNSHGAPFTKKINWSGNDKNYPISFLGWSGRITGNLHNYKKNPKSSESVNSVLFNNYQGGTGFRGFHTSSGCSGDADGKYPMDIGFYFFLEDFPKLSESYELFKTEYQKTLDYKNDLNNLSELAELHANTQSDIVELEDTISALLDQVKGLKDQHMRKYILENSIIAPKIDPKLEELKKVFRSYFGYGEFKTY